MAFQGISLPSDWLLQSLKFRFHDPQSKSALTSPMTFCASVKMELILFSHVCLCVSLVFRKGMILYFNSNTMVFHR